MDRGLRRQGEDHNRARRIPLASTLNQKSQDGLAGPIEPILYARSVQA